MARENNFLLGDGERLTSTVKVDRRSSPKKPPYDFVTARGRIEKKLHSTRSYLRTLPLDACPRDEVVAVVTMHPRYISKSDFPTELFSQVGLHPVGSKAREVKPDVWGTKAPPDKAITEDIFVAGRRSAFDTWATELARGQLGKRASEQLTHIEDLRPFAVESKLKSIPVGKREAFLEIVLHNDTGWVVEEFIEYAKKRDAEPLLDRRRDVSGLTFLPVRFDPQRASELASFAFVRVVRGMPALRPFRPGIIRRQPGFSVTLPKEGPVDTKLRAVIFDGGIPAAAQADLSSWVSVINPTGIGAPRPAFEEHGLAVTSAFLFGPLQNGEPIQRPVCAVDHVRVLDDSIGKSNDLDVLDALDRIVKHLDQNPSKYELVNISLGPDMAVDDDEVTAWTATLDARFANGTCVATVAAGNSGGADAASGNNRIQPPADAVNVLAVGAADTSNSSWARALYSSVGPGRGPGLFKPDGLAFGGSAQEGFGVLKNGQRVEPIEGTSFAAPFALRAAGSVRAQIGGSLNALAVRALMVHRAECPDTHSRVEVGWGRFETDPSRLITCDDDEALVVYQGLLPVSKHLRAPIPLPPKSLNGTVTVTATLVISPETDPEHPSAYTRAGLEVVFRPNSTKYGKPVKGKKPAHPSTKSFFSKKNLVGSGEYALREDGHKWEPCLRASEDFRASTLVSPLFDIYYHHREQGSKARLPKPIPYSLVVSIKAPKVPDLYDRVIRAYQGILVPLKPHTRIHIKSRPNS